MSKYVKYPSYRDSKFDSLSQTPKYWQEYRIDWVSTIVRGNTGFKKDELLNHGKYVALQYGKTYKVDEVNETFKFYVNDEFYKLSQVVHHEDTILISTSETIEDLGHSCFYNRDDLGLIGGEQILLKPNIESVSGKYFYYLSKVFCTDLKKYATGLKVFRFSIDNLKNIFISIPPLQEQQAIANYLDTATAKIDILIEKQTKLIELLKEKRQAVISTAVTRGLDNTVAMKDSGVEWLGEIPEHWSKTHLKYIANINMGQSPSSSTYNNEGIGVEFLQGNADFGAMYPTARTFTTEAKKMSQIEDILFTVRAPVGAMNIANEKYAIGRGLCAISSTKYSNKSFLWWLMPVVKMELNTVATGSTYEAVSVEQVNNSIVILPPIQEQQAIATYLDNKTSKIDILRNKATKAIELLKEKRTALISAVVTGKIDVREIV